MTTTTTSASLPSVIKASSPLDVWHLRLPPTSMPTSAFLHGDGDEMIEHGIFPSVMEESDDVPSSAFIHGDNDGMVEHGIFPSSMATYDDLSDFCHHIESESDFTTSPIYDELPQFSCEESHHHHHLSDLSDSTICDIECTYHE